VGHDAPADPACPPGRPGRAAPRQSMTPCQSAEAPLEAHMHEAKKITY
jgi:hypothetical protein